MAETRVKRPPTSQKLMGKNTLLFLNYGEAATEQTPVWALFGGQRNASFSMSADEVDVSDKTSGGWGETEQGIKSTEISIEGVSTKGNKVLAEIKAAFIAGEAVHILRWCKDGSSEINWYNITEFSDDAPMDDAVTFSITLKGCGEPTFKEDMADPRPAPVQ